MPGTCEERRAVRLEEEAMDWSGVRGKVSGSQITLVRSSQCPALAPCLCSPLSFRPLWT